ncbi:MAG TPA: DUF2142 domain-containing protein [Mycobacteriales bacterium]|nr:DUF2142 domain-containing protein [Mycobacteriales bacterium]
MSEPASARDAANTVRIERVPGDAGAPVPGDAVTESIPAVADPVEPAARRERRGLRAVPIVVWAAVVLQLTLGLAWTVLQGPYRGLDESNHVVGVLQLTYHTDWPDPQELHAPEAVIGTQKVSTATEPDARLGAPPPRDQRPSFAAEGGGTPTPAISQMSQHPPLYYSMGALLLRIVPGSDHWNYDRTLGMLRILSAFLLAPLPLLFWFGMRRFTADRFLPVAAAFVPLLLPGLSRLGGSVSNDALLILLTTGVGVCVARIVTGDASARTGFAAGVLAGLDLLTKGTALVTPAWLALAYLWCWRRWRVNAWPAVGAAAIPTLLGLVWWVRNVVKFHVIQPAGDVNTDPVHHTSAYGHFVTDFFSAISFRFWGSLGNPEPPQLDRSLMQIATYVVLALLIVGLAAPRVPGGVGGTLVGLFGFVGILGIITEGSLAHFRTYDTFSGVQGRYLYPALLPLAVLALLGVGVLLRGRLRLLVPVAVAVFAGLFQLSAGLAAFRASWAPVPGAALSDAFHRMVAWAPWPDPVTETGWVVLAVAAAALVLALVVHLIRYAREAAPGPVRRGGLHRRPA